MTDRTPDTPKSPDQDSPSSETELTHFQKMKANSGKIPYEIFVQETNDPSICLRAYPDRHEWRLDNCQRKRIEENQRLDWYYLDHTIETIFDVAKDLDIKIGRKSAKVLTSIVLTGIIAHDQSQYVSYSRNKNGYNDVDGLTYDTVMTAMKKLMAMGLVYNFIIKPGTNNKIQSFYCLHERAIEAYEQVLDRSDLLFGRTMPTPLTVKIREKKAKDEEVVGESGRHCDFDRLLEARGKAFELKGDAFEPLRADVRAQNEFLATFELGLDIPTDRVEKRTRHFVTFKTSKGRKGKVVYFNRSGQWRPFLLKTPSDTVLWGGRWYGGFWQGLSQEDRSFITINAERVGEEIDLKSLHATLCYDLVGKEFYGCPYTLPDIGHGIFVSAEEQRNVCKVCFFMLINAKDHKGAVKAMAEKLPMEFPDIWHREREPSLNSYEVARKVVEAVKEHNKEIAQFLSSDVGVKLQYVDSQIMTATQRRCRDLGIPILGVHDSILTLPRHTEQARDILMEEYDRMRKQIRKHGLQGLKYKR